MKKSPKFFRSKVFFPSFLPLDNLRRNMQKKLQMLEKSKKSEVFSLQDSTAIATTMPPGRYGARHATRWSASVTLCEATRCRHWACARAISARRKPWSSPSPSCQNTNKTQLLASDYCTFFTSKVIYFCNPKGTLYSRHQCNKLHNNVRRHDSKGSH
jgi:hypothetical protein